MDDHSSRLAAPLVDGWADYREGRASLLDLARLAEQAASALDNSAAGLRTGLASASSSLESAYYTNERSAHTDAALEILGPVFDALDEPLSPPRTREMLLRLLGSDSGEAAQLASRALREGAPFAVWFDGPGSAAQELLTVYRRREKHTRSIGLPTVGFAEAVAALSATDASDLHLASIEGTDLIFVLFVRGVGEELVGCHGVPVHEAPPL